VIGGCLAGSEGAYVTDPDVPYESVLVRLSKVNPNALRDLLGMAYKFVTRKAASPSLARRHRRSP